MRNLLIYFFLFTVSASAQVDTNLVQIKKYHLDSKTLETEREYWVSLPLDYDSTISYPVIYVLDAEWRFGITNALEKELSENGKIPDHIVVGIPHPDRKPDMTFSTTKLSYDGKSRMDSTYFGKETTGNGPQFLKFIEEELIKQIDHKYSTSGSNILIGHSLGGYFCSYILPTQKSFASLQIYDPSIWYSQGEAIDQVKKNLSKEKKCTVFLSSSSNVEKLYNYHHKKIRELNKTLRRYSNIKLEYKYYKHEDHNSMYMRSFIDGMYMLYDGFQPTPK